jgi:hypothetical protein
LLDAHDIAAQRTAQATLEGWARRYLRLAKRFRPDSPKNAQVNFFRAPVAPAQPGLLKLQDATVLTGEWFVTAGGVAYCDAFVQSPFPPMSAYLVSRTPVEVVLMAEAPLELSSRRGFLLGGCTNYCHWLMDYLPRLQFYRSEYGPLLTNGWIRPFQTQTLRYLGVKLSDLMPLEYPRAYKVHELFHPRTASNVCTPYLTFQPAIVDWLRDKFRDLRSADGGQRKLFISRAGTSQAHARRLLNEDEIAGLAREQGFEIVRCEELSFEAQVTMFSEASIIVGAHGAGLANLIFAPRTAKIVEMMGPRLNRPQDCPEQEVDAWGPVVSLTFMNLASILGQDYARIVGKSDDSGPTPYHLPFESYIIEPSAFLAAIRS